MSHEDLPGAGGYCRPAPSGRRGADRRLSAPGRAVVEGRVRVMAIRPRGQVEVSDSSPVIENPAYELLIRMASAGTSTKLESGNLPPRCGQ
jgi:hypothetical protein